MAKLNHTTTKAMQAAAKKGISLVAEGKVKTKDVPDLAQAGAKKIASGQKLSDEHVRAIAEHHDSHSGACPTEGSAACEDMMWGGPAGAMWANTRVAAMDSTALADDDVDLDELIAGDNPLSLELYGRIPSGEKMYLDESDDGLLWAPILRSGTLAVRPGSNGQKVADPLVFVAGHSDDPRKEIGLEDLIKAFDEGAVQHVTLPTTHENNVLDNTGFIEGMKLADSTLRQGKKVLMAAHRFTEPDVLGRVERGSIANRSCGILFDYTNTETGTVFPSVIEHVCLTNRPFVPGMEPYGQLQDLDFSDRTVVPLLLSDDQLPLANPSKTSGSVSDSTWDGSASRFSDEQWKKSCILDRGGSGPVKQECYLPVREPDGTLNMNAVHSAAGRIGSVKASPELKKAAAKKLVSLYTVQLKEKAPPNLMKAAAVSTNMSEESLRKELLLADVVWSSDGVSLNNIRSQLVERFREMRKGPIDEPSSVYFYVMDVMPDKALIGCDYGDYLGDSSDDTWVVPFSVDDTGWLSLSDFSEWTPVIQEWVTDDDAKTQKDEVEGLLKAKPPTTASSATGFSQTIPTIGGSSMSLTREQIGQLDLDDTARTALLADCDQREIDAAELRNLRADKKKENIKTYLADLGEKGFKDAPGFLVEVERALMADDGNMAAKLDLSDEGGLSQTPVTITTVVERLVKALPLAQDPAVDGGKTGSLLQTPIQARPEAKPEEENKEEKPLTGADLEAQWSTALGGDLNLDLAPAPGAPAPAGAAA